jgi:hypothetical protein
MRTATARCPSALTAGFVVEDWEATAAAGVPPARSRAGGT